MKIDLSVAIVTRNRPKSLETTLKSLFKQAFDFFEVIISDDSNSELAITENKKLAQQFGCSYVSGPQKGLYANRNFVAKQCSGSHIRTMDDDHEFPENHFYVCLEAVTSSPHAIWTIGEYTHLETTRTLPAPVPGQLHPKGFAYRPEQFNNYYGISCGASIYPKSVIENNILNTELYKFGIVYLEYGARLTNKGYKIKHLTNTYVIHNSIETSAPSDEITNEARIFSILMLSFLHKSTLKNKFQTLAQITLDLFNRRYSIQVVKRAYLNFQRESKLSL